MSGRDQLCSKNECRLMHKQKLIQQGQLQYKGNQNNKGKWEVESVTSKGWFNKDNGIKEISIVKASWEVKCA